MMLTTSSADSVSFGDVVQVVVEGDLRRGHNDPLGPDFPEGRETPTFHGFCTRMNDSGSSPCSARSCLVKRTFSPVFVDRFSIRMLFSAHPSVRQWRRIDPPRARSTGVG